MALYVDTAALPEAEWALKLPFVSGFTCNPVLVSEALGQSEVSQKAYDAHLEHLASQVTPSPRSRAFVQVLAQEEAAIVAEAEQLVALLTAKGERKINVTIKIPFTEAGLLAARALAPKRVSVAITGVFSPEQAYMAAATGVDFIIPYVSRLAPQEQGPVPVVLDMVELLKARFSVVDASGSRQDFHTRLLAASIKSNSDLSQLLKLDNVDVTVPPSLLRAAFAQPALKETVTRFRDALKVVAAH